MTDNIFKTIFVFAMFMQLVINYCQQQFNAKQMEINRSHNANLESLHVGLSNNYQQQTAK